MLVRITVTFGRPAFIGSTMEPENVAKLWAAALTAPIATVSRRSARDVVRRADPVVGARLSSAFNMAVTLLSRLQGRAIAGAGKPGNGRSRCCLAVQARSSRWL